MSGLLVHAFIHTTFITLVFFVRSFFFSILSFCLFFLFFLSTSPSFSLFLCPPSLFPATLFYTIYHCEIYHFLPLNCFWLLMGVLPRLPIGLPTLLEMCWLHHSPFLDKIACLVSYLSPFFTSLIWIRIKPPHYLPL